MMMNQQNYSPYSKKNSNKKKSSVVPHQRYGIHKISNYYVDDSISIKLVTVMGKLATNQELITDYIRLMDNIKNKKSYHWFDVTIELKTEVFIDVKGIPFQYYKNKEKDIYPTAGLLTYSNNRFNIYVEGEINGFIINEREYSHYVDKSGDLSFYGFEIKVGKIEYVVTTSKADKFDFFTNYSNQFNNNYQLFRWNSNNELTPIAPHLGQKAKRLLKKEVY